MKRKIMCNQMLDSSMYLEVSDREAEALQGGAIQPVGDLKSVFPPVIPLVLLFANPFSG